MGLVTSGSRSQGVQLSSSVELGLGLHEGCSVIGHELVASIRVLAEVDQRAADNNKQQKDQSEGRIGDEQNHTNDTVDESRGTENV